MRATSTSVLFSPRRLLIAAGLAALVILVAADKPDIGLDVGKTPNPK
jgi:hypothetical protein